MEIKIVTPMKITIHAVCRFLKRLAVVVLIASSAQTFAATTLYFDDFESYPAQNPAPNPLTNGPAGGQWVFVDPSPATLVANEHQILNATAVGAGFYSRVWACLTNNGRLTNAISLATLPPGTNVHTYRLSFGTATDTLTAGRFITFNYDISSSAGTLTFLSGHNLDDSQTFSALSGSGSATSETKGKTPDRQFEFVFQGSNLTSADKIFFGITRVTNNAPASPALTMFLDDVRLTIDDDNAPLVQSVQPVLTMQHTRVTFSEAVNPASATNVANYSFSGGTLSVQGATMISPSVVELYTTDMSSGSAHTLQISEVTGLSGISMTSTQLNFTAPTMAISPVRYDAGTTTTQPSGPADPVSPEAGYWQNVTNIQPGMSTGPAVDDGSGFNAWRVTDANSAANGGSINYTLPIDQDSINLSRSNGWRIVARCRMIDNFGNTAADQVVIYTDPVANVRYGLFWGVNAANNLYVTPLGGNSIVLTTSGVADTTAYHTHVMIYNPATKSAAVYFDGRLVLANYTGQAASGRGLIFGSASSTAKGEMNYNLVQLDVVGATRPVVTLNPQSGTYGVGQKVTFTAAFSPFVNSYQWLSNGVIIAGATGTNYTTGFVVTANNGDQYRLRALSALGNVETASAILTVSQDTNPPVIAAAQASPLRDRITFTFSEPVLESYATNIANYSWVNAGVTNLSAKLLDPLTVELRASPFVGGSNYTVRVSNVRDASNLTIAPNSPATVRFAQVTIAARYDAGNSTNTPAGPPDPTSTEGGNWVAAISLNPDISTNAIVDDLGTGLNAWQIRDASTTANVFASYSQQLATNLQDNARQFGWVLTVRSRLAENFGANSAMFALYEDYRFERFGLIFGNDANNDLLVGTSTTAGFTANTLTTGGTAMDAYHLHQLVYDAPTATASYYFDGNLIASRFLVSKPANSLAELMWGARASAAKGTMNYNLIEFSIVDGPFVQIALNNGNAEIAHRGILESTSQLSTPRTWTPVATNLNGGTYSAPLNGQTQLYFRARQP
ncbi:MAG: outer rane adhesin like protein [Verrucomicrobiales bacterium]|nr:outer rane adhesin like protein [Verrucomicrobiales bacterium]